MSKADEFYENLKDGRCKGCDSARRVSASMGFSFLGCFHNPYKGKSVAEIKDCPKTADGNKLMNQCRHTIGGKVNEIGETLLFCEITDNLENVTLGNCIGNCEAQEN